MRTLFVNIILFISSSCLAQNIVAEGNVWVYIDIGHTMESGYPYEKNPVKDLRFTKFYFNGCDVINGKEYLQLWETEMFSEDNEYFTLSDFKVITPRVVVCMREENGNVFVNKEQFKQTLLNYYVLINPDSTFESKDDEYILAEPVGIRQELYNEWDINLFDTPLPNSIGNIYNMMHFFPITHLYLDGVRRKMYLNLFYRDGKLEYKSPDFYPDPFFPEETADGIDEIIHNSQFIMHNDAIFNLQGQRINRLQKGLNIVDGKKMWVR